MNMAFWDNLSSLLDKFNASVFAGWSSWIAAQLGNAKKWVADLWRYVMDHKMFFLGASGTMLGGLLGVVDWIGRRIAEMQDKAEQIKALTNGLGGNHELPLWVLMSDLGSFVNTLFPLNEFIAAVVLVVAVGLLCWSVRIIKSLIPTVA